jgi:Bacterial extracellular solute-binding protein
MVILSVALTACGGDDGDTAGARNPGAGRAAATVHTVPQLEPVVRALVDAYSGASNAGVQLAVGPQPNVAQAAAEGRPAILPGPWLTGVNADSVAIGRNLAIIAVPAGNPRQVTGVGAFAPDSALNTAVCAADSPFGNFGSIVVARGGVQPDPARVSSGCEADALARVARGELDAALVFRSFLQIPAGVEVVSIPDGQNLVIDVRYAPVAGNTPGSFQAFLTSNPAKQLLTQQGLLP